MVMLMLVIQRCGEQFSVLDDQAEPEGDSLTRKLSLESCAVHAIESFLWMIIPLADWI